LTAVINSFVVFKAFIARLNHILFEILLHVLLVSLNLEVGHFVQISVFVVELLQVAQVVRSPTVITFIV
jgi:hypothetical protein